ncbi:uncharacterized protein LOC119584717 [Penaeus monodon]|uniref:uncharacterized protein LOC119584717 n=1 Tax=Penaeus monodon TaxID=6687 RepID=UPI0018A71270|nr:uncharacterized protein LOC119584717 [Penaeus monodon]
MKISGKPFDIGIIQIYAPTADKDMEEIEIFYENHPRKCWTWKSPGDSTRNQIDYILMQERYRNSITSCRSMPGADCGSDHIPVVGTMDVKLKSVKNKFDILDILNSAEQRWQKIKESINEAAKEQIPITEKRANKKWMTPEITDLTEERGRVKQWSEYTEELYKDERGPAPPINTVTESSPILAEEVEQAIKKMKKVKAAGPDNVPTEIITALKEVGIMEITKLLNIIYDTGELPNDLTKSRQFGFVADKGTRNAIFTINMLLERSIEVQKHIYLCFIDYSKAFDKVRHEDLFTILSSLNIDAKDLCILRNL